ncbi:hypothetical protein BT93_L0898 [Corymbia citriodora subsp. variegata]|uniref:AAA+ ATPase domain-containing protein n=1 Tax=Corymbia citriodora subsp. variegata TaxID=360336 RepID=A0A8T0D098_CORYI|nr:hypothetical protein BT93_L0898 [Corymbia citriodora subsp. variegata]
MLQERNRSAVQNVVGIDDRVKQITNLLEMEVNDEACIIGIYGTDGIGKTTLAKAVYNRISSCFDSCSFLADVKETTQNPSGIQFLQTKLIRDILERDREDPSFDEKIEDFLDIFHEMKVLIVIDDVEKQSYLHAIVGDLHWFGLGSRIIVTSQNEEILKEYDPEKARTYMVGKLDDNQAFELFCQHAFGKKSPIPGYDGHVNCIVNATEKLPLAIEVTGSFLRAGDFESMPNRTFLKLDNTKVFRDYTGAFPSLKWLCWQSCPSDFSEENFVLRELVILDLSGSKVTEDWRGWSQIKMEKLKVLNLMGCSDILITPNFSGYKDLEILILERCSRLVKLDPSIGHLKRLVSLNLKSCSQLNKLPVELGHMTALEELFIDGTSVRKIPISIGNLKKLKFLSGLKCFQLSHLPSSVSCLIALSVLSLDGTKISDLPRSLGELLSLRRLSLRDCHYMQELPDSIGKVGSSLEELDISATSISTLPNSIKNLQNLRVLRMDSSFVRAFPVEIGNLTKLEELHASWCRSLQGGIPRDIKRLYHLRSLTLGHSSISSLPSEISTISSLYTLDLLQCNEIEVLPKLPPSLICLRVSSKRMKAIPCLKDLKELEELYLSDKDPQESRPPSKQLMPESKVKQLSIWFSRLWNLEFLETQWTEKQSFSISFPKLRKLELSLSRIIKLHIVYEPTDIPQLKTLTLSGMSLEQVSELPKTLSVLSLRGCSSLKRLPIVQSLTNISAFELYHSAIEEIEGLEGLKSLKRLDISNCKIQNLNGIVQLTSLGSLIVSDCDYLHSLPDLSNLKLLKVLEIRQCKMIQQIEGLEELTSLEKLKISECPAENSVQVQNVLKLVKARSLVM